ncbi:MAG: hypothetical protein AAF806_02855 [Bacteroidota bacterium]
MNIITILHNKAMEFADEAEIAKHKKSNSSAKALYLQAFQLEKEAALKTPLNYKDSVPRHVLLRSAASLAMLSEQYEEAEKLILLGLNSTPPSFVIKELNDLALEIKTHKTARLKSSLVQLVGLFTYVNAAENEIKIQAADTSLLHTLIAPSNLLKQVVKDHFLERVNVEASLSGGGILLLTDMKKAA